MGICTSCCEDPSGDLGSSNNHSRFQTRQPVNEPDPETKRRLQAEAAEKRQKETESRGVHDPERVKRLQQRKDELERARDVAPQASEGGLRWTTG
ncbi:small VCP/p97-interacting protein-like [Paramacrobiotus metropolitanus]|uniref:small VCP/p97-interacting protein-like n=1 Tax=Paramacrobiotus metropolitanus TaxID=2943436 RepID=UPI00244613A3|nr:small VCP/p97-interacting protein-like [Paramacrobiotus metropolitanus]